MGLVKIIILKQASITEFPISLVTNKVTNTGILKICTMFWIMPRASQSIVNLWFSLDLNAQTG